MRPKVSVIIPSYNHSKYISKAILSATQQTYNNIEIIVIDDGSSDNSCELISKIDDPRIIFVKQENQGANVAINHGMNIASGDFVAILNSDDLFAIDRIEMCLQYASNLHSPCFICSYIEIIDSEDKKLGMKSAFKNMFPYKIENPDTTFVAINDPVKNLLMFNYVATTSNFFFHRSLINSVGYFNNLRYVHDWDYLLRIIKSHKICIIPIPLLKYRLHSNNTIKENHSRMILEICWILAKNYPKIIPNIISEIPTELERFQFYDQLYNSIQVYGCEKVILNLLFMFNACQDEVVMRDLDNILNPEHILNQQFIERINILINNSRNKQFSITKNFITRLRKIKNILFQR